MDLSRQHLAARLNEPAFVDDDPGRAFSRQRDSHDLAFRGGRSSVMDNMLRSLDQMQEPVSLVSKFHHYDADYLDQQHRMLQYQLAQERQSSSASGPQGPDYPSWSAGHSPPLHRRSLSQPKTSPVRRREHTHSSSYSSAYNARLSDELNRRSSHQPHARRSNSVSTSHSSLYRHDTVPLPFSGSAAHGQPRLPVLARPYGDTIPTTSPHGSRLGHASGGGSFGPSSFKLGQESASTTAYESAGRNYAGHKASTDHGRSGYDGFEAGPTPLIPTASRTRQSSIGNVPSDPENNYIRPSASLPIPYPHDHLALNSQQHRYLSQSFSGTSTRPTTGGRPPKHRSVLPDPSVFHTQASDFVNAVSKGENISARPGHVAAPSPNVALEKPWHYSQATLSASPGTGKERSGFLRRFFGSSRLGNTSQQEIVHIPAHLVPSDIDSSDNTSGPDVPESALANSSNIRSKPTQPPSRTEQSSITRASQPTQVITKKNSSFFRRRKKSIAEPAPPPLPPPSQRGPGSRSQSVQNQSQSSEIKHQHSEIKHQHLNPSGGTSRHKSVSNAVATEKFYDASEQPPELRAGGRQPDTNTEMMAEPVTRTVKAMGPARPTTAKEYGSLSSKSRLDQAVVPELGKPENSRSKSTSKGRHDPSTSSFDKTFFADSSSNEDRGTNPARPSVGKESPSGPVRPKTSPGPVADSSFLVGEDISPTHSGIEAGKLSDNAHQAKEEGQISKGETDMRPTSNTAENSHKTKQDDAADTKADGWVARKYNGPHPSQPDRLWLEPTPSDEHLDEAGALPPPLETPKSFGAKALPSPMTDVFHSATSLPMVQRLDECESAVQSPTDEAVDLTRQREISTPLPLELSAEDLEEVKRIFAGQEVMLKGNTFTWLCDADAVGDLRREAFMELFDWSGLNFLAALRILCDKLRLKGESQQVVRIMGAFATRWSSCNPNHGFKSVDVIYAIAFSLLILNTDLHAVSVEQKIPRSRYIKNTLLAATRIAASSSTESADDTIRPVANRQRGSIPWPMINTQDHPRVSPCLSTSNDKSGNEPKGSRNRLSVKPPFAREDSDTLSPHLEMYSADANNFLVSHPYEGTMTGWENLVETVLKAFFASIRQERLPLYGADVPGLGFDPASTSSLSVAGTHAIKRTPSSLSKVASENESHRGRLSDNRTIGVRWISKSRSRPRLMHHQTSSTVGSSRTSFEDYSPWSPTGSSTWSKHSQSRTAPTASVDSIDSRFSPIEYQKSIGFANALSQAMIREEGLAPGSLPEEGDVQGVPMLDEETLELAGAPWGKEGLVKHKHRLEAMDKKAKDRTWVECFAVIERGWMRLFSFSAKATASVRLKTARSAMRNAASTNGSGGGSSAASTGRPAVIVGGGNWSSNASPIGSFLLRQTIASALPPPGYSKARPNVWALSLPTGAVHFFQVGTPEIVKEFVSTVNYWSARLSKEPLVGGISNVEYGWSDNVINPSLVLGRQKSSSGQQQQQQQQQQLPPGRSQTSDSNSSRSSTATTPTTAGAGGPGSMIPRPSIQSSIRGSSIDMSGPGGSMKSRMPSDKIFIAEWTPPVQSMMASALSEADQHKALTSYVHNVEEELKEHTELRSAMTLSYSPRQPNAQRALSNWERKSAFLLSEIVKYRTYLDSLTAAHQLRVKMSIERGAAKKEAADAVAETNNAGPAIDGPVEPAAARNDGRKASDVTALSKSAGQEMHDFVEVGKSDEEQKIVDAPMVPSRDVEAS